MQRAFAEVSVKRAVFWLALAIVPFLVAWILLKLQMSSGILRYVDPLARYVFLATIGIIVFDMLWTNKKLPVWPTPSNPPYSLKVTSIATASIIAALCLLALLINWSNGGTRDVSAIGGILPYSDAA